MRDAKGWVTLHRKIWTTDLWMSKKPFDERSAWIDLILMADYEQTEKLKRGQVLTSYGELADRWHWSKSRVHRFIHKLQDKKMVKIEQNKSGTENGTQNGTVLTIEKYAVYQSVRNGMRNEKRKHYNNINNIPGRAKGAPGPLRAPDPPMEEPDVIDW